MKIITKAPHRPNSTKFQYATARNGTLEVIRESHGGEKQLLGHVERGTKGGSWFGLSFIGQRIFEGSRHNVARALEVEFDKPRQPVTYPNAFMKVGPGGEL